MLAALGDVLAIVSWVADAAAVWHVASGLLAGRGNWFGNQEP